MIQYVKRVIIKVLAMSLVVTSFPARAVEFITKDRSDEVIKLELHANLGLSSLTQNYSKANPDIVQLNYRPGTMLGVGALAEFPLRDFISLGTALDLNHCGGRYTAIIFANDEDVTGYASLSTTYYYATFPVYMSLGFNVSENVRWHVDCGAYYAYGFGGHSNYSVFATHENSLGQIITEQHSMKEPYFNSKHPFMHSTCHGDYGVHLAIGFLFDKHYHLNLTYRHGVKNIARRTGPTKPKAYNAIVSMSLGYKF